MNAVRGRGCSRKKNKTRRGIAASPESEEILNQLLYGHPEEKGREILLF